MTILLRALGAICPSAFGIDFRLVSHLHRRAGFLAADERLRCANGFYMVGDTSNAAYVSGLNERAYMRLLARLIQPGQIVYNVGANAGYLALWLARHFAGSGGLTVVGFEPDPRTARGMERNVALNPDLDVRTEPVGLGEFDGTTRLYSAGAGDGAASILPRAGVPGIDVRIVRLDTYQRSAAGAPDWLILDVEGMGGRVLAGAARTLAAYRPKVAAEIHSADERSAMHDLLAGLNYRIGHQLDSIWGKHVIWMPQ